MKILMLNNEYPPLGGGQAAANKSIMDCMALGNFGHQADLISSSTDKFKQEKTSIGQIYYLNIGKKNKNQHFQNVKDLLTFSIKCFLFARKLIKKNHYDLILAWAGVPSGFIAWLLKKLYHIPYVVLLRGPDVPFHEAKWKIPDKLFFRFVSPFIWKHAWKVIANSQELKNQAFHVAKKQAISVVENGVDVNYWINNSRNTIDHVDKIMILSVGRLSKIKGFDLVIEAINKIENKNLEYCLVGDGPERRKLEWLAEKLGCSDKVRFLGIKSRPELREIYHSANIFVLPSYSEGMSNALLEAMAAGLPVIVTNVGGTSELVNGNGIIVNKGNPHEILEAINQIIKNKETWLRFSEKSFSIAAERSWEAKTKELLKHLVDL